MKEQFHKEKEILKNIPNRNLGSGSSVIQIKTQLNILPAGRIKREKEYEELKTRWTITSGNIEDRKCSMMKTYENLWENIKDQMYKS